MQGVMIRRLTVDDLAAFHNLREEAMRLHPESFGSPEEERGGEKQKAAYRHWLKTGDLWGAFDNDKLLGTAGFNVSSDARLQNFGQVFIVYVRPDYRNKGIGGELLSNILASAGENVAQAHLCVAHTAQAAIQLFTKNGFEIRNTETAAYSIGSEDYDEHQMVKILR